MPQQRSQSLRREMRRQTENKGWSNLGFSSSSYSSFLQPESYAHVLSRNAPNHRKPPPRLRHLRQAGTPSAVACAAFPARRRVRSALTILSSRTAWSQPTVPASASDHNSVAVLPASRVRWARCAWINLTTVVIQKKAVPIAAGSAPSRNRSDRTFPRGDCTRMTTWGWWYDMPMSNFTSFIQGEGVSCRETYICPTNEKNWEILPLWKTHNLYSGCSISLLYIKQYSSSS